MPSGAAAIAALEDRIGYAFRRPELLARALTHASVAGAVANNETLEFLGDRVLGLLAAEALAKANPDWSQGDLSRRHAAIVSGPACASVARALGLGASLRLGGGATRQGGRDNERILGDAMEAVVAAVYLDGGLEAARRLFAFAWSVALDEALGESAKDAKSALQEWAMARGLPLPDYRLVSRGGPAHAPVFEVSVQVSGHAPAAGAGASLKAAQRDAARAWLERETERRA